MSWNDPSDLSRSFELRRFSRDPRANGGTDFKGETSVFDTEARVDYLRNYAEYAARFFGDESLDTPAVTDSDVAELLGRIKPQPLPGVRRRLRLEEWKRLGHRPGLCEEDRARLNAWEANRSVEAGAGRLRFVEKGAVTCRFEPQTWRVRLEWWQRGSLEEIAFLSGERTAASATPDPVKTDEWEQCVAEIDLTEGRWNLWVGEALQIEWAALAKVESIDTMRVCGAPGSELSALWAVGYHPTDNVRKPYSVRTILDERFAVRPDPTGWQDAEYDDSGWEPGADPLVHGSERHQGEDLYLRSRVRIEDSFQKAWLDVETLDPGGEVWVNGHLVSVRRDRHPQRLDITEFVVPGEENLVAVRVYAFDPVIAERQLPHSGSDGNIGWFAGRMHIDLTHHAWIEDLFVYATAVSADPQATPVVLEEEFNAQTAGRVDAAPARRAALRVRATVSNRDSEDRWRGFLRVRLYPWLPEESQTPVAETEVPVDCCEWQDEHLEAEVTVESPQLWTWRSPALYRVEATLTDAEHSPVDDEVVTTGIRTVSQTGGVFRINDEPEMLNGAQIFGLRAPLEKMAIWQRRPPVEWLVREIAQIRRMNGNAMRIHVHAWAHVPPARSVNDVRLAEIGDQLGIMFYWVTTAWIRSGTPWGVDLEGLPKYIRQVRNHPSIVLWELSNHPSCNQLYDRGPEGWDAFYRQAHEIVRPLDPSRLLAPSAICGEGSAATPALDLPGMTRGDMDTPTGMGAEWTRLRLFLESKRLYFEHRKNHAYFDFEHQESIGQPNWSLCRGKPWYEVMSYEHDADKGSIGRKLAAGEWRESQAWQAFSAYEAMRQMRRMGYDGFSWCCLHGGANTATYKKPLVDFLGHAKLCWHAHRMVFQSVLAGSDDVDLVYGPGDWIHPTVMNLGPERLVNVEAAVRSLSGDEVETVLYERVRLPAGRSVTNLPAFRPSGQLDGTYAVEYRVLPV